MDNQTQKTVTINLSEALVEELKIWKQAFSKSYGRELSYDEVIREFIDCVPETNPDVMEILDTMMAEDPAIAEKIGQKTF